MKTEVLIALLAASVAGPLLLRRGWQQGGLATIMGWGFLLFAGAALIVHGGAWAFALGVCSAMVAAMVLLSEAAIRTPAPARTARERAIPQMEPAPFDFRDLARRIAVFLLVVPVGLVASSFLTWSMQRALFHAGWLEANSTSFALFALPFLWLALTSWQIMQSRLGAMLIGALALAVLGGLVWLAA